MPKRAFSGELQALADDALGLVLPRECAGCGRPDRSLCRVCVARFAAPRRCEDLTTHLDGGGEPSRVAESPEGSSSAGSAFFPVWALADYRGSTRHAILAWKSGGRPDLGPPLAASFTDAVHTLGEGLGSRGHLLVIPAPSGTARRLRGRFVVGTLADAAGRGLALGGSRADVVDVLRRSASLGHRLGAAARSAERRDAVRALARLPPLPVMLVDDVVTTGATLAACADAVTAAGAHVVGAVALAVTLPPRRIATFGAAPNAVTRALAPRVD